MRGLRLAATALALVALGGCGLLDGKDEEPPAELPDFTATLRVEKVWSDGVGDGTEFLRLGLTPDSDGSRVFVATHDGVIAAYEAVRGRKLWRRKTKVPLSGGPATDGGLVVAGSANGDLVALRAEDGTVAWRRTVASEVLAPPALARGLVLVRTVDGKLTALRAEDGSQAWFIQEQVPRLSVRGTGAPVIVGDAVVCGFDSGRVIAYDIGNGNQLWQAVVDPPAGRNEVERLKDINATVRVIGEDLYAVGYQGRLAALAAESGQVVWSQDLSSHSGLAVDASNVYVATADGGVRAYRRRDGGELWQYDLLRNRDVSAPAAYGDTVVVGDLDGYVHFIDAASGAVAGRGRVRGGRVTGTPLVVGDLVYVQSEGGRITAFRARPRKR
jgi:outer membrane protein assembly factor BamB